MKNLSTIVTMACTITLLSMPLTSCSESQIEDSEHFLNSELAEVDEEESLVTESNVLPIVDAEIAVEPAEAASMSAVGVMLGANSGIEQADLLASVMMTSRSLLSTSFISMQNMEELWDLSATAIAYSETLGDKSNAGNTASIDFGQIPAEYRSLSLKLGNLSSHVVKVIRSGEADGWVGRMPKNLYAAYQNRDLKFNCIAYALDPKEISNLGIAGLPGNILTNYCDGLRMSTSMTDVVALVNAFATKIDENKSLSIAQRQTLYNMLVVGAFTYDSFCR